MMRRYFLCLLVLLTLDAAIFAAERKSTLLVQGLSLPESAAVGPDGRTYVSVMGERV